MGGDKYTVAPLNFRQLQDLEAEIAACSKWSSSAVPKMSELKSALPIVFAAVSRNYPDMKIEELANLLDLGSVREAFGAALGMTAEMLEEVRIRSKALAVGEAQPTPTRIQ